VGASARPLRGSPARDDDDNILRARDLQQVQQAASGGALSIVVRVLSMSTADAHSGLGWHDAAGRLTKVSLQDPVITLEGDQKVANAECLAGRCAHGHCRR